MAQLCEFYNLPEIVRKNMAILVNFWENIILEGGGFFATTFFNLNAKEKYARHWAVVAIVFSLFGVIVWRLVDLSHISRDKYYQSMERTRRSITTTAARRGTIFDRNFEVLASNEAIVVLGVDPYAADAEKDLAKICTLGEILGIDARDVLEKFTKRKKIVRGKVKKIHWVPICEMESESLHAAIKAMKIRGVYGVQARRRLYPFGRMMAHVTGFVNRAGVASCGVERYMNFYLGGQDGYIESERDGSARELVHYRKKEFQSRDGCSVVLTIDKNIQKIVSDEIDALVENFSPKSVSIIVSEVTTGEILALANYPDYDPNEFWRFPQESMKNLAVCSIYEPASIFGIVAMSFGLERGLVDEETVFDCTQATNTNRGKVIPMPKDQGYHGKLTFTEAVRKSNSRAVAQVALKIGEQNFYDCVCAYGFGEKAGYGFDGESKGIVHPVADWDLLAVIHVATGRAIGVVPLQVHCAMATIANDGLLLKPNLFKCVSDEDAEILTVGPVIRRRVISRQTAARMRSVLHNPDADQLKNGIEFAGKAGLSKKIGSDGAYISSHSGFFPVNAPKIAITVVIDGAEVEDAMTPGSAISLVVFRSIAERISRYLSL
ncbi:MAG: penicillin-binding protein 2 [Puniceicoccales bacterium]|nr:penicillin-binding protein 2 [Puniceicoccales bacterium]